MSRPPAREKPAASPPPDSGRRPQGRLAFRLMTLEFRLRDLLRPPARILRAAGVGPGMSVLDFGCGPGGFSVAAARLVGPEGRVRAMDINPLALDSVRGCASRSGIANLEASGADQLAGLAAESFDFVLLYDVLHDISEAPALLAGLHRVLRSGRVLSVSDHHLTEALLLTTVTAGGFFRLADETAWTYQFRREEGTPGRRTAGRESG